jgi:hypothetical protein
MRNAHQTLFSRLESMVNKKATDSTTKIYLIKGTTSELAPLPKA